MCKDPSTIQNTPDTPQRQNVALSIPCPGARGTPPGNHHLSKCFLRPLQYLRKVAYPLSPDQKAKRSEAPQKHFYGLTFPKLYPSHWRIPTMPASPHLTHGDSKLQSTALVVGVSEVACADNLLCINSQLHTEACCPTVQCHEVWGIMRCQKVGEVGGYRRCYLW